MLMTIWRHGTAQDHANDRQRELTIGGRDDIGFGCRQVAQALILRNLPAFTTIVHSPWVRTTQTAQMIAGVFKSASVCEALALQPGGDLAGVDRLIAKYHDEGVEHLLLVSHQPLVSRLIDHALGEFASVPGLPPGGLATLAIDTPVPACASLLFWAFPPEYAVAR